jgi:hypothetical protein
MCAKCKYYSHLNDDGVGHCVRHAPKPIRKRFVDGVYYATWPYVLAEFRCGEFAQLK